MIRVGFALHPSSTNWLGGSNYLRNLLRALAAEPRLVEPVALVGDRNNFPPDFPEMEVQEMRACRLHSKTWYLRQVVRKAFDRDWVFERSLRSASVDVLSHAEWVGRNSTVPTTAWIPDFQHLHYPEFFSSEELRARDNLFHRTIRNANLVIVSSEMARKDLEQFAPHGAKKCRVLQFSDSSACEAPATAGDALQRKYKLPERYFILPNQFWVHKNHSLVIEALGILKRAGKNLTVVATGNTKDHRRPGHYEELVRRIRQLDVEKNFRVLGIVPYEDLAGLMRHAVAVLNPSLFEGWSTTVEEARTLGKRSLLSSIPVHLEQAPPRAQFFDPSDAKDLSQKLIGIAEDFSPKEEEVWADAAKIGTALRKREFAQTFHHIAEEAVQLGRRKHL